MKNILNTALKEGLRDNNPLCYNIAIDKNEDDVFYLYIRFMVPVWLPALVYVNIRYQTSEERPQFYYYTNILVLISNLIVACAALYLIFQCLVFKSPLPNFASLVFAGAVGNFFLLYILPKYLLKKYVVKLLESKMY
ncbi:MAG: hypothetical protein RL660_36 [Bacteroidota bacterium]|jgi:hypothetical protein